jgi:hypothetical protein
MNHPSELVEGTPGIVRTGNTLHATAAGRQSCLVKGCFATFVNGGAAVGAVRSCNRSGPDGGHVHRWDGQRWQAGAGAAMQHDRT